MVPSSHFFAYLFLGLLFCGSDGLTMTDETTPGTTTKIPKGPSVPFNCTFGDETAGLCVFTSLSEDSACRWRQHEGPSPNFPSTGPPSGHKDTADGYLLFESNNCNETETTATIITKIDHGQIEKPSQCLKFYYFMYGGPNSLDVTVKYKTGAERKEFHREGNQGRRWFPAYVTIDNPQDKSYNLSFTAKARDNTAHSETNLGDIAIDDIDFSDGGCKATKDLCDFESGNLCGFTSESSATGANGAWTLTKAANLSASFGNIKTDHTFQTSEGHVASCETEGGEVARLVSELVNITEAKNYQVTFWYQIASLGQLSLRVKNISGDSLPTPIQWDKPIWSINNTFSPYAGWNFASVLVLAAGESQADKLVYAFEASGSVREGGREQVCSFALDDIIVVISDDNPYNPPNCDFENGECGWTAAGPNNHVGNNWVNFKAEYNLGEYGPYADHTKNSSKGHFMLFSSDYESNPGAAHKGSLWSPKVSRPRSPTLCFSFWHYTYKDRGANMDLSLTLHEPALGACAGNRTLIQLTDPPQNRWTFVNVSFEARGDYQLVFDSSFFNASRGNVLALDDFQAKEGACDVHSGTFKCTKGETIPYAEVCNGRYDCRKSGLNDDTSDELMCGNFTTLSANHTDAVLNLTSATGYFITSPTSFKWVYTPHCNPGDTTEGCRYPTTGHDDTFNLGYFKADFAGSPNATSTYTYLHSPTIHRLFSTTSLSFWYNICTPRPENHNDTGALIVSLQMISTKTIIALLDVTAINENDQLVSHWQQHTVTVGRIEGEFHFLFQARKARIHQGFIAIDEILIEDRMLPVPDPDDEVECKNRTLWHCDVTRICIEQDRRCDFTDDCGEREDERELDCQKTHPFRCCFDDESLCGFWKNDHPKSDVRWIFTTSRTPTAYTGPLRDHTTGLKGGGYIHAPSVNGSVLERHKAVLYSPVFAATEENSHCWMRFYYHMFGEHMGSLEVITGIESSPNFSSPLFNATGNHGDHWLRSSVNLVSSVPFRVAFIATVGGVRSDLALDDISFSPGCRLYDGSTVPTVLPVTATSRPIGLTSATPGTTRATSRDPATGNPVTDADKATASSDTTSSNPATLPVELVPYGLGGGAIAGIVIGLLIVLAGGFVLLVLYSRKGTSGSIMPRGAWSRDSSTNYEEFSDTENLEL